jgi:hypothetical protein
MVIKLGAPLLRLEAAARFSVTKPTDLVRRYSCRDARAAWYKKSA